MAIQLDKTFNLEVEKTMALSEEWMRQETHLEVQHRAVKSFLSNLNRLKEQHQWLHVTESQ